MFAAATVLWEVLTGSRLFAEKREAATIAKIISGNVAPPSTVRAGLEPTLDPVVLRGLSRTPDDRFPTALAMAAAIDEAIDVAPPSQVAAWVDSVMHEELAARRARVREVESGAAPSAGGGA